MAIVASSSLPDASLSELVNYTSLKWIFVGGKGGVGKTTTSCCLGIQLARVRRNVLIVSTDPAHNLSDAFGQKFSRTPQLVDGFTNLFCMEVDPNAALAEAGAAADGGETGGGMGMLSGFMKEFSTSIPGIDEAISFAELMKHMQTMEFDVTVFDTAPTGHTLRLLALPATFEKALDKIMGLRDRFGGLLSSMSGMFAGQGLPSEDQMLSRLDDIKRALDNVQSRLHNPDETTFVCVCIPEFLSLYETERLVQELTKFDIDTQNIVVNQVLFVEGDSDCVRCRTRARMQGKYLEQIHELYEEDFHVVTTPLLNEEIRGAAKLRAFGEFLLRQYTLATPIPAVLAGAPMAARAAVASST